MLISTKIMLSWFICPLNYTITLLNTTYIGTCIKHNNTKYLIRHAKHNHPWLYIVITKFYKYIFFQLLHEWPQSSNWTHSKCKRNTMRLLVLIVYIWKKKVINTHFIITTFPSKCSHESQQLKFFKFIILFSNVLKKYALIMSFHYEKTFSFYCNLDYFYNVIMSCKL